MAGSQLVGRRIPLVIVAAGIAFLSMTAPSRAGIPDQACCFAAGICQVLSPSACVSGGGVLQSSSSCATVTCPLLCSAAGPECNGECPAGTTCVNPGNGRSSAGATTSALSLCQCVPEIPEGGACAAQPDACAPGLVCLNGICSVPAAPAPLLSAAGLGTAFAILVVLGGVAHRRRHRE